MKKNILMVGPSPPHQRGGGESQQRLLSHMFKEKGYKVFVLSMGTNKIFDVYYEKGIKVYRIFKFQENRRGSLSVFQALKYVTLEIFNPLLFLFTMFLIIKHRINSVNIITYNQISLSPLIASKLLMRNIVVTMHSHELLCSYSAIIPSCRGIWKDRCGDCLLHEHELPKSMKKFEIILNPVFNLITSFILSIKLNMTNHLADKIVFPSVYSKKTHLKYGINIKKTKVIPCFLNKFGIKPVKTKKKNDKKLILYIGKVEEEKGIKVLIQSIKKLLKYNKNFKLIVIGDGRSFKKIKRLTHKLRINKYVDFFGSVSHSDVFKYYSFADIVVIPSVVPETFSIVLLEASLSKKITICSRIGALEERIIDGKTGFLVEPNNSDELAKKIHFVLKNYRELKHVGERAYLDVSKKYGFKRSFSEYLKLLG